MITFRADSSKWEARYRRILSRRAMARREVVIAQANLVVRRALATSPVDTGRFKRNLAQAGNAARLGPFPVIRTKRSRYEQVYLQRLSDEVAYWNARYADAVARNWDEGPGFRKIRTRLARAELELRRFEQTNDAIVIGGLFGHQRPTVRYKNYVGKGRIQQTATQTIVTIHNTEAHASLVEHHKRVMRNAISSVRAGGGSIASLSKKSMLRVLGER